MRTPRFWNSRWDPRSLALAPLGWLYGFATKQRLKAIPSERLPVPVISVGNLNAGGTGKTPTVIALVQILRDMGHVPHVVSRGYGGTLQGPVKVDPARHSAAQVGDEPLLIAAFAETWVSKNRAAGGKAAAKAGASVIVLDDAHQNPGLAKDLSLICVKAEMCFGNGRCLPAGPLREPIPAGLARADALISIGPDIAQKQFTPELPQRLPRLNAELKPLYTGMTWSGQSYIAFAGIAQPEIFFATLRSLGAKLIRTEALGDHEPLSPALLTRLENEARLTGAQLVTTEKDAARLPPAFRGKTITLPVRLEFEDQEALQKLLPKPS
jgi:tetraacyldisaccharide 4'-kinase